MADTDFYNRNMFRNYPLVEGPPYVTSQSAFSNRALVDFGIVFLEGSGFDPDNPNHKIYPESARQAYIRLKIKAIGALVDNEEIDITSPITEADFSVHPFTIEISGVVYAFGFMVLGESRDLPVSPVSLVPSAAAAFIERRCIQVPKGHYVNEIVIANERRVTAPDRCLVSSSAAEGSAYSTAPRGSGFTGDVRFREGFNADIVVLPTINAIRFSARRGKGAGEACKEVPRTWDEIDLFTSGLPVDGAVRCQEVVSNINGIQPDTSGNFTIRGGRGVEVTSPAAHTIRIAGRDSMEEC